MKKILRAVVAVVGIYGVSDGMQKAVTEPSSSLLYKKDPSLPFSFIGKNLILEASGFDLTTTANKITHLDEERLDSFLAAYDLSDSELEKLEQVNSIESGIESLEQAFFSNKILYGELFIIKEKILQGEDFSSSQKELLNWLIQNRRGDYECAKILVTFYSLTNGLPLMSLFWRRVARFLNLPVRES